MRRTLAAAIGVGCWVLLGVGVAVAVMIVVFAWRYPWVAVFAVPTAVKLGGSFRRVAA